VEKNKTKKTQDKKPPETAIRNEEKSGENPLAPSSKMLNFHCLTIQGFFHDPNKQNV